MSPSIHVADIRFVNKSRELVFRSPHLIVSATRLEDVAPCLEFVATAVEDGLYAAGFVSYEAAGAFDPALVTRAASALPLVWFGLYDEPETVAVNHGQDEHYTLDDWEPLVSEDEYRAAVQAIRAYIGSGDTYQVNYSFPLRAQFDGDSLSWFRSLCANQPSDYSAYIDTGEHVLLSASPELFFRLDGDLLTTKPMKGTRQRGLWAEADKQSGAQLACSEKDRAENVMIVDLLRSDMGRISETGSVVVLNLFDIERFPTLWQMTSCITSRTRASLPEIFRALFPSGSVTGAPKVRTMQLIRDTERYPRGIYCGAMGWWSPERKAEFNVAIRTVSLERASNTALYHVGSGITWDSSAENEHRECRLKAAVLTRHLPDFKLLESMLFDGSYFLLDEHLARLSASADYFDIPVDMECVREMLREFAANIMVGRSTLEYALKIRIRLFPDGAIEISASRAKPPVELRLGFAIAPVDATDVFLYHKTTHRAVYDRALVSRPDCDDVMLWNEKGELTESCFANLVLEIDGVRWTPSIASGLLPGTMRAHLLAAGEIQERILTREDLMQTQSVWLINSVRKWIPCRVI